MGDMRDEELTVDDNWCPDCGEPREACLCTNFAFNWAARAKKVYWRTCSQCRDIDRSELAKAMEFAAKEYVRYLSQSSPTAAGTPPKDAPREYTFSNQSDRNEAMLMVQCATQVFASYDDAVKAWQERAASGTEGRETFQQIATLLNSGEAAPAQGNTVNTLSPDDCPTCHVCGTLTVKGFVCPKCNTNNGCTAAAPAQGSAEPGNECGMPCSRCGKEVYDFVIVCKTCDLVKNHECDLPIKGKIGDKHTCATCGLIWELDHFEEDGPYWETIGEWVDAPAAPPEGEGEKR